MEKTLDIQLAELREQIAQDIENRSKGLLEDAKSIGSDAYLVATQTVLACTLIARGKK